MDCKGSEFVKIHRIIEKIKLLLVVDVVKASKA